MKEYFIILIIFLTLYFIVPVLKSFYMKLYRKKTIEKFTNICNKIGLNMNIEDSMKVYQNKIEHRYTIELHRRIPFSQVMDPLPMNSIMNEIRSNFDIDSKLDKNILELSKQYKVEEFFYGKHPYLPYEKVYIGFQNQNYGYLIEKKKNSYTKRIYMNTKILNLMDIYPHDLSIKLQSVIPTNILNDEHIYKYDDGKDKPITVYLNVYEKTKLENVMEVFTKILKVFNTKDKVIDEANEYMKKYKDHRCYYIGLTNKYGEYFATLYYDSKFTIND